MLGTLVVLFRKRKLESVCAMDGRKQRLRTRINVGIILK